MKMIIIRICSVLIALATLIQLIAVADRIYAIGVEIWRNWGNEIGYICISQQYDFIFLSMLLLALITILIKYVKEERIERLLKYCLISVFSVLMLWIVILFLPVTQFVGADPCW